MDFCPRCSSGDFVKAGIVAEKQRYKCKKCNFYFTVSKRGISLEKKRLAIHLYLEGISIRRISRILDVSDTAVRKWLAPLKDELSVMRNNSSQVKPMHKVEHFLRSREIFSKFGWILLGLEENQGTCLLGSHDTGNCELDKA